MILSDDKRVQQTEFSDGSKITANFNQQAVKIGDLDLDLDLDLDEHTVLFELTNKQTYIWQSKPQPK